MELVRTLSLAGATLTTGLVAGLFYAFSVCVMRALRGVEDHVFVDVMQRINTAILNGWFLLGFAGAPLLTVVAAVVHWNTSDGALRLPLLLALVLYVVMTGVTRSVNIRLNDELDAAGPSRQIREPAVVRSRFEVPWTRANNVRTLLSTAALGCLCWALLAY